MLARDPAAHADLDSPRGVTWLLVGLRDAGAPGSPPATSEAQRQPPRRWTYNLFPGRGHREATFPAGLPPTHRIRKISLDSSPIRTSGTTWRNPAQRTHPSQSQSDRTPVLYCPFRAEVAKST